jgi:hypothetical protein
MQLADDAGGETRLSQLFGDRRHPCCRVKIVDGVGVAVLAVGMAVVPGENVGTAAAQEGDVQ